MICQFVDLKWFVTQQFTKLFILRHSLNLLKILPRKNALAGGASPNFFVRLKMYLQLVQFIVNYSLTT